MGFKIRTSNELQIGKAGEYLVCADLILKGFIAYPSEQGLPYDVCLDIGSEIKRVQVKTTQTYRMVPQRAKETKAYIFNIRNHGKSNKKKYTLGEVDLFALVVLDTGSVGYLKHDDMASTMNFRVNEFRGTYYDEKGIQDYEKVKKLSKEGLSGMDISRKINIGSSAVYRMLRDDYEPHQTNAKYFSDIERGREWFLKM